MRSGTADGILVLAETVLGAPNSPARGQRSRWLVERERMRIRLDCGK